MHMSPSQTIVITVQVEWKSLCRGQEDCSKCPIIHLQTMEEFHTLPQAASDVHHFVPKDYIGRETFCCWKSVRPLKEDGFLSSNAGALWEPLM